MSLTYISLRDPKPLFQSANLLEFTKHMMTRNTHKTRKLKVPGLENNFVNETRSEVLATNEAFCNLAPVVRRLDNAIHRINRYPTDKCHQNILRYPADSDLSGR